MNTQKIIEIAQAKKPGEFLTLKTERECKTRKGSPRFFKATKMQLRVGHNYYNQKSVKEAHASGEMLKANPEDLWHEACELGKAFRQHKKSKAVYVAGQPCGNKPQVEFFTEDGQKVKKSEIENFLLASEKTEKKPQKFATVILNNVTYAK